MLDPVRAKGVRTTMGLALSDEPFMAKVEREAIILERGTPEGADATLSGAPPALAALVYGGRSMAEADVRVLGSRTAARVFCGLFTLAAKA